MKTRAVPEKHNKQSSTLQIDQQPPQQGFEFQDNRATATSQRNLQQAIDCSPRQLAQAKEISRNFGQPSPNRKAGDHQAKNHTGLPDQLRDGVENLSGMDLSDVRVHTNSPKPAQLDAFAYAQGTEIHLGPGQAEHLPHEAWHVAQQKQGKVKPTRQLAGSRINDDASLEHEADVMGTRALTIATGPVDTAHTEPSAEFQTKQLSSAVVQLGRDYPGGNPKGRGGKGGYFANKGGKAYVHKSGKAEEEMLRRQAIGRHHAKSQSANVPRARDPAAPPRRPAAGPAAPPRDMAPEHPGPVPIPAPALVPAPRPDAADRHRPDDVIVDIGDAQPEHGAERGMGERIRDKAFGGRTFGDSSNLIGATANLVEETVPASTLLVIGSSGVMVSGIKLFYDGLTRRDEARTSEERREGIYTIVMGLANMISGITGIESAIAALIKDKESAATLGIISTGAWATTELTNIVSQIDIIRANLAEGEGKRAYIKPIAAILASLMKCIGGVIYVYASIVSSSENSDDKDLVNIGVVMMMVGAAMSTLHGIIKLLGMCMGQCSESQEDVELPVMGDEMV
jgi:hypothetical protein